MLTIKLMRKSKKGQPFFRIIVNDKRRSIKTGKVIEDLGFLNPLTKEKLIKKDRLIYWLKQGAKVSKTIHNLLIDEKILKGEKLSFSSKRKNKKKEVKAQNSKIKDQK